MSGMALLTFDKEFEMKKRCLHTLFFAFMLMLAVVASSCSVKKESSEKQDSEKSTTTRGEHARDIGGDAEGEESGTEFALN